MTEQNWLLLIYRLPREPSRPRVAAWRKLKALGAHYLQDGVVTLPDDAVTREQLEWLQLQIREANGEATLWQAQPTTASENTTLVETFHSSRKEAYRELIARAERIQRKAQLGGSKTLPEELSKLEREFRIERRRDYFQTSLRNEAAAALKAARRAVRERNDDEGIGAGSGG